VTDQELADSADVAVPLERELSRARATITELREQLAFRFDLEPAERARFGDELLGWQSRAQTAERELAALRSTKLFRAADRPRRLYAYLRSRVR
jgi:hypothetical protein